VFRGVGERTAKGNDLYEEFKGIRSDQTPSDLIKSKVGALLRPMNEPPGLLACAWASALHHAKHFRDVNNQDVLLFIDNIFRFVQGQDRK